MKIKKIVSAILAMALSASMLTAFAVDNTATNDNISGNVVIKTEDGTVLTENVDYTLEYKDNIEVGKATVIVHFIGNYKGEKAQTFNIKKKSTGGGGGGSSIPVQNNTNVTVTDKDGNPITVTKKEDGDKVIITLPTNKEIKEDDPVSITVTDKKGNPVETEVVMKDKKGNEATGKTDKDGKLILPVTVVATPEPTDVSIEEDYDHTAYISGYDDNTFRPDGKITRAETASMLNGVISATDRGNVLTFTDLQSGAWYVPAVTAMTSAGIINGYGDGTFKPNNRITRAEFVTMLMQNEDVQQFDELPFTDVSTELWSADYIYTAYKAGYINGYEDGTFRPDSPITRAEAVKIINSVMDRTDLSNENNPFTDVNMTHWAYKQILEAAVNHNLK